jgi:hypothetical protein
MTIQRRRFSVEFKLQVTQEVHVILYHSVRAPVLTIICKNRNASKMLETALVISINQSDTKTEDKSTNLLVDK